MAACSTMIKTLNYSGHLSTAKSLFRLDVNVFKIYPKTNFSVAPSPFKLSILSSLCLPDRFFALDTGSDGGGSRNFSQSPTPIRWKVLTSILKYWDRDCLKWFEQHLSLRSRSWTPPLTRDPTWAPSIYALHDTRISCALLKKCPLTKSSKCCSRRYIVVLRYSNSKIHEQSRWFLNNLINFTWNIFLSSFLSSVVAVYCPMLLHVKTFLDPIPAPKNNKGVLVFISPKGSKSSFNQ